MLIAYETMQWAIEKCVDTCPWEAREKEKEVLEKNVA
jgi:hypothetical protein